MVRYSYEKGSFLVLNQIKKYLVINLHKCVEMYVVVDKPSFMSVTSHRASSTGMMKSNMLFTNHCTIIERFYMVVVKYRIHIYFYDTVNPVHM